MPIVPLDKQVEQRGVGAPTFGNRMSLPSGFGRAVETGGMTKLAEAVGVYAQKAKDKGDAVAILEAQRKLDDWEASNLFDPKTGALAKKGKDAFDLPNKLGTDFDTYAQTIEDTLANDDQKLAFQKMRGSRYDDIRRTLYSHERTQMDAFADATSAAAQDGAVNRAALFYTDPAIIAKSVNDARVNAMVTGRTKGLPDDAIANEMLKAESKVHLGALTRMADNTPSAAMEYYKNNAAKFTADDLLAAQRMIVPVERKVKAVNTASAALNKSMPALGSDQIIDWVIDEIERGQDKPHPDGDGMARFGINSKANPDVDLNTLTKEGARAIYKSRYWDAMKIDELPADMRLVAYDAAVNHGVEKAKQMVADAGGDARILLELREDAYRQLAKSNPAKYADNLPGWLSRLAKVSQQVDMMRGQTPSLADAYSAIDASTDDVEVAEDAKKLVKAQLDALKAAREEGEKAADDEAWNYRNSGMEVPASVEARMSSEKVNAMRNAAPDPVLYAELKQKLATGQPLSYNEDGTPNNDLSKYRWQLGNKYNELAEIANDPTKLANARTVEDVKKNAYGRLLGKPSPKSKDDYTILENFDRAIDREVAAFQKQTGKVAGPDDVQKMADRLLLTVNPEGWAGARPMVKLDADTPFEVKGIPNDRSVFINGNLIEYPSLLQWLMGQLERRGVQVNQQNLATLYQEITRGKRKILDSQGNPVKITEKYR